MSLAASVASCGPSTKMLNAWTAPEFQSGSIRKVMVLGVARNEGIRRSYEDKFVGKLKDLGYDATVSYLWAPDVSKPDSAAVHAKAVEAGVTHIITTRLIDKKMVETYIPPTYVSTGYGYPGYPGYYGSWGSYWSMGYTYAVDPGYVSQDLVISLETNLYGVDKANLLWSGITETWVASDPASNVDAVIEVTVAELRANGIL
jgi:hypothetical protein